MVQFSLNIKAFSLNAIWEKKDQIWAKFLHTQKYALPYTYGWTKNVVFNTRRCL